ncbi:MULTISPECIES: peptidase [unclassified Rhodococcus (in: high G+C Gram-positive bacteria)]|uniref:peptidase n=1 Tax=unclassified Rhodococcus (in: high G+C Gram-positive bacteria) TaxID=192944 RepID=UPI0021BF25DA|nr:MULTISPECIES: peptidase [unclassified Rhodococcus (in: high G+C Gram-positive bacteria)]
MVRVRSAQAVPLDAGQCEENVVTSPDRRIIGVAPFHASGTLRGFVISGRWPDTTKEWAQLLAFTVRVASTPGLLDTSTVFCVREELPEDPHEGTVGIVVSEGPVIGDHAVTPERFALHQPAALMMLHPPSETMPTLPECAGAASGCVLLPGLPHLGLDHRAAWVEAEADGTVTSMISRVGLDPISHPDTAVLAMLLAA